MFLVHTGIFKKKGKKIRKVYKKRALNKTNRKKSNTKKGGNNNDNNNNTKKGEIVSPDLIHDYAAEGNLKAIEEYLKNGYNIFGNYCGLKPIHIAAENNQIAVVKFLLQHGERVNSIDEEDNNTPLHYACMTGSLEMVKLLISKGADVDAENYVKETPLLQAVYNGNSEIVEILLKNGADVEVRTENDRTALMIAATNGNLKNVELLIKEGAKIDAMK